MTSRFGSEPKEGESFDFSEIAACLDYTTAQVSGGR
jgi:hypothetical protein